MARATDRRALPAVLASPMLADRLAAELTVAAEGVQGDGAMDRERRAFLAGAAVQVEGFGSAANLTEGQGYAEPYRPTVVRDDIETRAADAG